MNVNFNYNQEKDIWCLLNKGKSSNNSQSPTKVYEQLVSANGENLTNEAVSAFIEKYISENKIDLQDYIAKYQKDWDEVKEEYTKRAEEIFKTKLPQDVTAYLTINNRCPYNIEENYFFVSVPAISVRRTVMHELFHFYTWYAFGEKLTNQGISKERYNDIKESLTVILNTDFSDLLNGAVDNGYPQHQEMRTEITRLWSQDKDMDKLIVELSRSDKDWSDYYKATRAKPPRPLLVKALEFISNKGKAIDLGGGALNDTRYLLEQGFDVTVIDKSPLMEQEAKNIKNERLHALTAGFEDFNFPKEEYDLASAMFALPFTAPAHFDEVFEKIKGSLKKGGIFCGQLFGDRDEWKTNSNMTFHTKEQAQDLLSDLEVISFKEDEKDDKTAKGEMKHWHVFHIIARKP